MLLLLVACASHEKPATDPAPEAAPPPAPPPARTYHDPELDARIASLPAAEAAAAAKAEQERRRSYEMRERRQRSEADELAAMGYTQAPEGWNRDGYASVPESGFLAVADAPLSTFAVDVDTASYTNVRRFLAEGRLPPPGAVRVEEMINYFRYADAPPTDGAPVAVRAEVTQAPWAPEHLLVRVGLKAREVPPAATPPRNLVFLVDVSGSMEGEDRLPLVVRGLELLASQLGPEDHVSLVVYAGAAGVVLPPTPGDRTEVVLDALARLDGGGSTAGGAGIRLAYDLARENFRAGAVNRVILATDGDFNVGTTSDAELVSLIEKERASGVFLTVLGVGRGNLQDAKMEQLADHGNGAYAYIDSFAELRRVLGEELGATLVTVAKDVKVQVELNPARVSAWRLVGYENRALEATDFVDDHKDAGEMGAGHAVTALYELVPAGTAVPSVVPPLKYQTGRAPTEAAAGDELLTVKVRYKAPDGDTSSELALPVGGAPHPFAAATPDTRWAATVAGFGMLLRGSELRGGLDWEQLAALAAGDLGPDPGGYRAELRGMIARAGQLDARAGTE